MTVIDRSGTRVREWCAECAAYHKAANCKKARDRRRREKQKSRKWWAGLIEYSRAITAESARRKAGSA